MCKKIFMIINNGFRRRGKMLNEKFFRLRKNVELIKIFVRKFIQLFHCKPLLNLSNSKSIQGDLGDFTKLYYDFLDNLKVPTDTY